MLPTIFEKREFFSYLFRKACFQGKKAKKQNSEFRIQETGEK